VQIPQLIAANSARWQAAQFNPHALSLAHTVAERLCAPQAKAIYQDLATQTGVPWFSIALIHQREASQSWRANIANGDPWNQKTKDVPRGRGPFPNFRAAAIDALVNCSPYAGRWKDWSAGGLLSLLELYNGEGYENYHHMASPYLFAGSDQYICGKYIKDGQFDPDAIDHQLGCAVMLKAIMEIDASVSFEGTQTAMLPAGPPAMGSGAGEAVIGPSTIASAIGGLHLDSASIFGGQSLIEATGFKALINSKMAWLSGTLGIGSAASGASSDPQLLTLLEHLASRPAFWIAIVCVIAAGAIAYFHWRDPSAARHW
jgi:lysozyme family protein